MESLYVKTLVKKKKKDSCCLSCCHFWPLPWGQVAVFSTYAFILLTPALPPPLPQLPGQRVSLDMAIILDERGGPNVITWGLKAETACPRCAQM